jgi:outer membrane protein TolC
MTPTTLFFPLLAAVGVASWGCQVARRVDIRSHDLIHQANLNLADGAYSAPEIDPDALQPGAQFVEDSPHLTAPETDDPPAEEIEFQARDAVQSEAEAIIARMEALAETPPDSTPFGLRDAIRFAQANATEYSGAEETYLLTALSLVIRERAFEPRLFNTTALESGYYGGARYDTALKVTNDFGVRQQLPHGGEVTARFLTNLTRNLDFSSTDNGVQGASIVIDASLPLLKGAGLVARESLIQAQRNLVYAARAFEHFRRGFLVAIVSDYLDLVLRLQRIDNAERGLELNRQVEAREIALVLAGREQPFQADLARAQTLFALDDLARQQEAFRLALDRFKVRIGLNTDSAILIERTELQLPIPDVSKNLAVRQALDFRLDLQTARDQLQDSRRQIDLAENGMLPDLALRGNVTFTGPETSSGLSLQTKSSTFAGGLYFSAPLDRIDEAVALRRAQIIFAQAERVYQRTLDEAALEVRQAIREIDRAQFSLLLAEQNVGIAKNRIASIDAAPDRANARDRTEAVAGLRDAEDSRDDAKRNLQVEILRYLRSTGTLRVTPEGDLQPLPNMPVGEVRLGSG